MRSVTLTLEEARHLVQRAGIGAEWSRIGKVRGLRRDEAVRLILREKPRLLPPPRFAPYAEELKRRRELRKAGRRKDVFLAYRRERDLLQEWAVRQLLHAPAPLHERMVWFWHNHFTTGFRKVKFGQLMLQHDRVIRRHALGRFFDLLKAASLSPAMLIYLDGRQNRKEHPNENFARELLELFTLGEGHYTEKDIREAARALTGWIVDSKTGRARFVPRRHDDGVKEFLGHRGRFGAQDIFRIILGHPRTAEFICEKLWREFVSLEEPPLEAIRDWAATFRRSGYDIRAVLATILQSDALWAEEARGRLVKSPVDFMIGTLRTFDIREEGPPPAELAKWLRPLGQELFQPPDVKGWRGGHDWLDDVRLLRRQAVLRRIIRSRRKALKATGGGEILHLPKVRRPQLAQWLLAQPAVTDVHARNIQYRVQKMLFDPAYQVM